MVHVCVLCTLPRFVVVLNIDFALRLQALRRITTGKHKRANELHALMTNIRSLMVDGKRTSSQPLALLTSYAQRVHNNSMCPLRLSPRRAQTHCRAPILSIARAFAFDKTQFAGTRVDTGKHDMAVLP
jgi:hypothetical protein